MFLSLMPRVAITAVIFSSLSISVSVSLVLGVYMCSSVVDYNDVRIRTAVEVFFQLSVIVSIVLQHPYIVPSVPLSDP